MEEGGGGVNFKNFKYDIKILKEKKQIEDMFMSKMGKCKYSLEQFVNQILESLLKIVKQRCNFARQTALDIHEKTLRQLMLSLNDKEVKESLKKNEEKLILRFNTCLILMNNIEDVVNSATRTWTNI